MTSQFMSWMRGSPIRTAAVMRVMGEVMRPADANASTYEVFDDLFHREVARATNIWSRSFRPARSAASSRLSHYFVAAAAWLDGFGCCAPAAVRNGSLLQPFKKSTRLAALVTSVACSGVCSEAPQLPSMYATAPNVPRAIRLDGDATVWLNGSSKAEVVYSMDRVTVDLLGGDAVFVIAGRARRRYDVVSGIVGISRARGTFEVHQQGPSILSLTGEGRLSCFCGPRETDTPNENSESPEGGLRPVRSVSLVPDEYVGISRAPGGQLFDRQTISREAAARDLSWRDARIVFDDATLAQIMQELAPYAGRRFVLEDPALASARRSGSLPIGDLASILSGLDSALGLVATDPATNRSEIRLRWKSAEPSDALQ
jgi:ferric-dicitrate binding protein FerR (iron transport regulator)